MLWIKSFHIISMVAWFAGLFYLPRLFVYHAQTSDKNCHAIFQTMEYKLYYYIMHPAFFFTLLFGSVLYVKYTFLYEGKWIHIKIFLTILLSIYHIYLGRIIKNFKNNRNVKTHTYYRIINEVPTVILILIVMLVVIKPF